jgi:hypothetical protein
VTEDAPRLGEMIYQLRRELEWARRVDKDHPIRLEVGTIELDVTLSVSRTTGVNGGVVLKVLSIGGKKESIEGETTRLHLLLTPHDRDARPGDRFDVGAKDVEDK